METTQPSPGAPIDLHLPQGGSSLSTIYEIAILFLSLFVLVALAIDVLFKIPPETSRLLLMLDHIICGVFFVDFAVRLWKAPSKAEYMKWGWVDLLSSIPMVDAFRIGRIARIVRVVRILRAFRSTRKLVQFAFHRKARSTFETTAFVSAVVLIFSSIIVLNVENVEGANIKSAEDALWWSWVTMTTVGYGDKYPVTTEGRIVGALLMTVGVGLFGTFTAMIASLFGKSERKQEDDDLKVAVANLADEVRRLHEKLDNLEKSK